MSLAISRRGVLAGSLALAGCQRPAEAQALMASAPVPGLKSVAPFRLGTCVQDSHLRDPAWVRLAQANCSQITPEWEMKMEYIVQDDGSFRFDRPDRIADFARANGMGLYGTTLVWYDQKPPAFLKLDEGRIGFGQAFDNYITAVVGRYRGAVGWDVVNEVIAEDGDGWRDSLWASRLGDFDHMVRAFHVAHEADPDAVLFLNEYNLESLPKKFDSFQRLAEKLMAAGVPIGGVGCQSHLNADMPAGAMTRTLAQLARLGLPIHLSELDVSQTRSQNTFGSPAGLAQAQARVYAETAEAFCALPPKQQFAFTLWGLRDQDSWLRAENVKDMPAPFDELGQAKLPAQVLAKAFAS